MIKRIGKWIRTLIIAFFILSILGVISFKILSVPITPFMIKRFFIDSFTKDTQLRFNKDWVSLDEMSKTIPLAVISSEDQNFLTHRGFDFKQIQKAMEHNEEKGTVRGASTISQQTAKNVFLWDGRNFIRKGFEAYFTLLIEFIWGKRRIIEVYLNVAEFGQGIYGVEAASEYYFNKNAQTLTRTEAATLAALLPNPRIYGKKIQGNYIQKRKNWILKQMRNLESTISLEKY